MVRDHSFLQLHCAHIMVDTYQNIPFHHMIITSVIKHHQSSLTYVSAFLEIEMDGQNLLTNVFPCLLHEFIDVLSKNNLNELKIQTIDFAKPKNKALTCKIISRIKKLSRGIENLFNQANECIDIVRTAPFCENDVLFWHLIDQVCTWFADAHKLVQKTQSFIHNLESKTSDKTKAKLCTWTDTRLEILKMFSEHTQSFFESLDKLFKDKNYKNIVFCCRLATIYK